MDNVGIFCDNMEYFTAIWYILWPYGNLVVIWYIFPCLVNCVKKNLATLVGTSPAYFRDKLPTLQIIVNRHPCCRLRIMYLIKHWGQCDQGGRNFAI
jgi:hypothetical protein